MAWQSSPGEGKRRRGFRPAAAGLDKGLSRREDRVFRNVEPHGRGILPGPLLGLIGFIGLCLLVGAADGALTEGSLRAWYAGLAAPPGTPPVAVFGPVWTVLYVLMGTAAWLVWRRGGSTAPLRMWGWQLALNAAWTPMFFGLHDTLLSLWIIAVLLVLVALIVRMFRRVDGMASALMLPYLAWVAYATYLNAGFWWLNG